MRLAVLILAFLLFTGWTFTIVADQGLGGFVVLLRDQPWGRQVWVDLGLSLMVSWAWLLDEAKGLKLRAWPWIVGTLLVGSIAVLGFLIRRELALRQRPG